MTYMTNDQGLGLPALQCLYVEPPSDIESSYAENQVGRSLFSFACRFKPHEVIEFGVLNGYSLSVWAQYQNLVKTGVVRVHNQGPEDPVLEPLVKGYDLFDKYPYKRPRNPETVLANVQRVVPGSKVQVAQGDVFDWFLQGQDLGPTWGGGPYNKERRLLLHVDISNDGDKVRQVLAAASYRHAVYKDLVQTWIVFEGGTFDRDQVEWMKKFNRAPMYGLFADLRDKGQSIVVTDEFPGVMAVKLDYRWAHKQT